MSIEQDVASYRQAQHEQCTRIEILRHAWEDFFRGIREEGQRRYPGPEGHESEVSRVDGRHERPYPVDLGDISSDDGKPEACKTRVNTNLHRPLQRGWSPLEQLLDDGRRHACRGACMRRAGMSKHWYLARFSVKSKYL